MVCQVVARGGQCVELRLQYIYVGSFKLNARAEPSLERICVVILRLILLRKELCT